MKIKNKQEFDYIHFILRMEAEKFGYGGQINIWLDGQKPDVEIYDENEELESTLQGIVDQYDFSEFL